MATAPKAHRESAFIQALRSPSLPVLLTLCAVAVGLAAFIPLIQSSVATTTNSNVQRLDQERIDWEARLHELELDVATMGSLDRIEREAIERLHMTPPQETRYTTVDVPAPEQRRLPSRFLPPEPAPEEPGSSIWEHLFGWLPLP